MLPRCSASCSYPYNVSTSGLANDCRHVFHAAVQVAVYNQTAGGSAGIHTVRQRFGEVGNKHFVISSRYYLFGWNIDIVALTVTARG